MELREISPYDVPRVQELIESDPGYTERITGYPPGPADAQSLLMMRPDGLPEDAKVVLGAWEGEQLVAVIDLLKGYPDEHTAFIGLLEVHEDHQGRGVGAAAYRMVEAYRRGPEWRTLRLAVVDTNAEQAAGFWARQGFEPTGEVKPYTYDKLESTVRLYEKQLTWSHPDLEVRRSGIAGQGLFATRADPQGRGGLPAGWAEGEHCGASSELLKNPPVDTITLADDEHLVLAERSTAGHCLWQPQL